MKFLSLSARLPTPDLERAVAFYRDVLGFTVELRTGTFAVLASGGVEIQLYLDAELRGPAVRGLLVETEDVAGLFVRVKDRARVLWGPEVYSYLRRELCLADPDGNELIFSEPTGDPPSEAPRT